MLLAQGGLKIGSGQMLGMSLMGTPLHKEAVSDAAQQTDHEKGWRTANPAAAVIVRNVQPLMQAIFDASKASPVEFQPLLRVELFWWRAAQQGDLFILAALGLA